MEKTNTKIEVNIGGQNIKLTAYESAEYIRNVAHYIDNKLNDVNKLKSGSATDAVTRWLLVALNIADELFKERENKPADDNNNEINNEINNELQKMKEENYMLNEKISELQLELVQVRKEFDDFLEAFGD